MRVEGVPFHQGKWRQGVLHPTAGILHRTYGSWRGDYSVGIGTGRRGIGFHFLVGKMEGRWAQFYDTNVLCHHAKGANGWAVGIEIEGRNEEPLTDWQVRGCAWIVAAVSNAHGIPLDYYNGMRRRTKGWQTHSSVPGSDHTDTVTPADWLRIYELIRPGAQKPLPHMPAPPKGNKLAPFVHQANTKPVLRRGGRGTYVVELQQAINRLAKSRVLPVDGVFGPKTESWVKLYQSRRGLKADGIVGPQTWLHIILEVFATLK